MKHLTCFSLLFFLAISSCHGEWFDGEVSKVDQRAKELTITEIDPITETEEAAVVSVPDSAVFTGVKSLKEIKDGDEVVVEANYDEENDSWQAVSVEVSGAGA